MRPTGMPAVVALVALTGVACKSVDPAPTTLDDLVHFFFLEYGTEDSELLADGVDNLIAWHETRGDPEGFTGSLSQVTPDEKALVGLDPESSNEWLKGVFELVPGPGCTPRDYGLIYAYDDQLKLFPSRYDEYTRDYHLDAECYRGQSCDEAAWTANINGAIGLKRATYAYEVELRDLVTDAGQQITLARSWLPEAALVGDNEDGKTFFDQSYSIEVFAPYQGEVLHLYALWNSAGHTMLSPSNEMWERQYVDGITEWNDRMDELCTVDRGLWD